MTSSRIILYNLVMEYFTRKGPEYFLHHCCYNVPSFIMRNQNILQSRSCNHELKKGIVHLFINYYRYWFHYEIKFGLNDFIKTVSSAYIHLLTHFLHAGFFKNPITNIKAKNDKINKPMHNRTNASKLFKNMFKLSTWSWVWASESGLCWDPQSLRWVWGRWGAVTPGTTVQPGAPSEHSCLCLAAGESQPLKHLPDCRQSGDEWMLLSHKYFIF